MGAPLPPQTPLVIQGAGSSVLQVRGTVCLCRWWEPHRIRQIDASEDVWATDSEVLHQWFLLCSFLPLPLNTVGTRGGAFLASFSLQGL